MGNYVGSSLYGSTPSNPAFGDRNLVPPVAVYDGFELIRWADHEENQPVVEVQNEQVGNKMPTYGFLDFYNRIHIQYSTLNLGAVVSTQEVPFRVFNAYFVPQDLTEIVIANGEGLLVIEPSPAPLTYQPLQELTYILKADTEGPANIDATITFDWDGIEDVMMRVTGTRVIGWRWQPNWGPGIRERLEWLTDVMEAFDNTEQRRQLRLAPRQFFEFTIDVEGRERRILENALYNWGARTWALPIWPDGDTLKQTIAQGATVIPIDTATRQFKVGELIMLIAHDESKHEALEVDSYDADSVTTTQPTSNVWGPGTRIYPARLAKLTNPVPLSRFLKNYAYGIAEFRCEKGAEYANLSETMYRTYPVLTERPDWKEDPSVSYLRKMETLDGQTGVVHTYDEAEIPILGHSYRWALVSRAEIDYFRKWLYSRAGRAKGVWVPTFVEDLVLATTINSASSNMDVEFAGITAFLEANVHRRDIRIELMNGTVLYRRVTGFVVVDEEVTERLTLSSALGVTLEPKDIRCISWMTLCRLDSDSIEIAWDSNYTAEALTVLRSYRNDI